MTENKRFTINDCRVLSDEQVFKILNQLTEENEQLKNICKNLINEINKRGITVTMTDNCKEFLE